MVKGLTGQLQLQAYNAAHGCCDKEGILLPEDG